MNQKQTLGVSQHNNNLVCLQKCQITKRIDGMLRSLPNKTIKQPWGNNIKLNSDPKHSQLKNTMEMFTRAPWRCQIPHPNNQPIRSFEF
jgi:hypothetical protein